MKEPREGGVVLAEENQWIKLPSNDMYQVCCNCGLTHYWEFRVGRDKAVMVKACSIDESESEDIKRRKDTLYGKEYRCMWE